MSSRAMERMGPYAASLHKFVMSAQEYPSVRWQMSSTDSSVRAFRCGCISSWMICFRAENSGNGILTETIRIMFCCVLFFKSLLEPFDKSPTSSFVQFLWTVRSSH